jgi:hypothetical protein
MNRMKTDNLERFDTEQTQVSSGVTRLRHPMPLEPRLGGLLKRRDLLQRVRTTG